MSRSFTVEAIYRNGNKLSLEGGRYISSTPSSAAKKAFAKAYHELNGNGKLTLVIHIKETTQDSSKKIYKYKVSKIKKITQIPINGEIVTYQFTTKIVSV